MIPCSFLLKKGENGGLLRRGVWSRYSFLHRANAKLLALLSVYHYYRVYMVEDRTEEDKAKSNYESKYK